MYFNRAFGQYSPASVTGCRPQTIRPDAHHTQQTVFSFRTCRERSSSGCVSFTLRPSMAGCVGRRRHHQMACRAAIVTGRPLDRHSPPVSRLVYNCIYLAAGAWNCVVFFVLLCVNVLLRLLCVVGYTRNSVVKQ